MKDAYDLSQIIFTKFSLFSGIVVLLSIFVGFLVVQFSKKYLERIADRLTLNSVEKFKKQIEISFRDESIRAELGVHFSKKSIEIQLKMYEEIYSLYFSYQSCWRFTDKTPKSEMDELYLKLISARKNIFINSVYLGGYLTDKFLGAVIMMTESFEYFQRKIFSPHTIDREERKQGGMATREATDYIHDAEKWIIENLGSHQTLSKYELTEEQINTLKKRVSETIPSTIDEQLKKDTV